MVSYLKEEYDQKLKEVGADFKLCNPKKATRFNMENNEIKLFTNINHFRYFHFKHFILFEGRLNSKDFFNIVDLRRFKTDSRIL